MSLDIIIEESRILGFSLERSMYKHSLQENQTQMIELNKKQRTSKAPVRRTQEEMRTSSCNRSLYTHTHTHTYTHIVHTHTHTHMHTHTLVGTYTHTHTHTLHTHTHTHIHTHNNPVYSQASNEPQDVLSARPGQ